MPEYQPYLEKAKEIFPGVRFLHIMRNGFDVIASSIERGWYTDDYMKSAMIDWVESHIFATEERPPQNVPWWLDSGSKIRWKDWNQATRSACVWRCLTEIGRKYEFSCTYESFTESPLVWTKIHANAYDLEMTSITKRHIEDIRKYPGDNDPEVSLDDIEEPEKTKFVQLMKECGYL